MLRKSYGKVGGTFQDQYFSVKDEDLCCMIIPPPTKIILWETETEKTLLSQGRRELLIHKALLRISVLGVDW